MSDLKGIKSRFNKLSDNELIIISKEYNIKFDAQKYYQIRSKLLKKASEKSLKEILKYLEDNRERINCLENSLNTLDKKHLIKILRHEKENYPPFSEKRLIADIFLYLPFDLIEEEVKIEQEIKNKEDKEQERIRIEEEEKERARIKAETEEKERRIKIKALKKEKEKEERRKKREEAKAEIERQKKKKKKKLEIKRKKQLENFKKNFESYDKDFLFTLLVLHNESFDELEEDNIYELYNHPIRYSPKVTKETLKELILSKISIQELFGELNNPIVIDNFFYKTPRKYQIEAISLIYNALKSDKYEYIILEAPPGFGKTGIANTIAGIYKSENKKSYILTKTNQLIGQYIDEVYNNTQSNNISKSFLKYMQPRSRFNCKRWYHYTRQTKYRAETRPCTISQCIFDKCNLYTTNLSSIKNYECDFLVNLSNAMYNNITISNYDTFLLEHFYYSDFIKYRDLIICDEAHNIDDKIASKLSLEYKITGDYSLTEDYDFDTKFEKEEIYYNNTYYDFALELKDRNKKAQRYLKEEYKKYNKTAEFSRFVRRDKQLEKFLHYFENDETNLVVEIDEEENKWKLKPLSVRPFMNDLILNMANKVIFMSSSFFDVESYAYDLNLDPSKIFYLRMPSNLDYSKNTIKIYNGMNMGFDTLDENFEKSVKVIREILENSKNEKGIIHTYSYEIADKLREEFKDDERILVPTSDTRESELNKFKNTERPLVLISPSVNEGVDLPNNGCKFQIIYKLPYLPHTEKRIEMRKIDNDRNINWYYNKMISKLIQTYGRGIRSDGDYCKTYILDERIWDNVIERDVRDKILPRFFLDAIEGVDSDKHFSIEL